MRALSFPDERVYRIEIVQDGGGTSWRELGFSTPDDESAEIVDHALELLSTHPYFGWDDPDGGPWAMRLPGMGSAPLYAVAIRLGNNGTTLLWSPVELPWLAEGQRRRPATGPRRRAMALQ